jgi:hypothetical protein
LKVCTPGEFPGEWIPAMVVATVPPPTTIAAEASVTPLPVMNEPEFTVVVPAHTWLAFTSTFEKRPAETVKSTLDCGLVMGPRALVGVRLVTLVPD